VGQSAIRPRDQLTTGGAVVDVAVGLRQRVGIELTTDQRENLAFVQASHVRSPRRCLARDGA
jgi:hypothetical protein